MDTQTLQDAPPPPSPAERIDEKLALLFEIAQHVLISLVAIALIVLSCIALWDTVELVREQLRVHDLTKAISEGVDTLFLTVILLELMHTVTTRGPIARQTQEFIVIGITSAIRHGLSIVASGGSGETITRRIGGHNYTLTVPGGNPRDAVINLAINSVGVLLLVVALWLVRHRFGTVETAQSAQRDRATTS
jgi:hypothetical protein